MCSIIALALYWTTPSGYYWKQKCRLLNNSCLARTSVSMKRSYAFWCVIMHRNYVSPYQQCPCTSGGCFANIDFSGTECNLEFSSSLTCFTKLGPQKYDADCSFSAPNFNIFWRWKNSCVEISETDQIVNLFTQLVMNCVNNNIKTSTMTNYRAPTNTRV